MGGGPIVRRPRRSYLDDLFRGGEMPGPMRLTLHNLTYYADRMAGMRRAIADQRLAEHSDIVRARWKLGDVAE